MHQTADVHTPVRRRPCPGRPPVFNCAGPLARTARERRIRHCRRAHPIGRAGSALADLRPDDLAAASIAGLVRSASLPVERIEDVSFGCANQAGEDDRSGER
jgi:hypothetical protein